MSSRQKVIDQKKQELANERTITVGELRRWLSGYPDDAEVIFGCSLDLNPLVFYRVKNRGPQGGFLASIELTEIDDQFAEEALRTEAEARRALPSMPDPDPTIEVQRDQVKGMPKKR